MPFSGKPGDSIFIDDLGGGHRYVVLTKPDSNDRVRIVNFTADEFGKDCTVTFKPKHHRKLFIKPTVVNYRGARPMSLSKLESEAAKTNSEYIYCPANIFNEIILGAFKSNFTPTGIQAELEKQYPNIAEEYYRTHPFKSWDT